MDFEPGSGSGRAADFDDYAHFFLENDTTAAPFVGSEPESGTLPAADFDNFAQFFPETDARGNPIINSEHGHCPVADLNSCYAHSFRESSDPRTERTGMDLDARLIVKPNINSYPSLSTWISSQ